MPHLLCSVSQVSTLASRIRGLLRGKLGRCPKCMRWSILGAIASWIAYIAIPLPVETLVVPFFFTALAITHVLVHMFLTVNAVRAFERQAEQRRVRLQQLGRHEVAWIACRAGFSFALLAAFKQHAAFAQGKTPCKGHHKVTETVVTGAADRNRTLAERNLAKALIRHCDQQCETFNCAQNSRCETSGKVQTDKPECTQDKTTLEWTCKATVKGCPCDCFTCAGGQKPIGPFDTGIDLGSNTRDQATTRAATDAQQLCQEFCVRFVCPGQRCQTDVLALGATKTTQQRDGTWDAAVAISKCTCRCQGT